MLNSLTPADDNREGSSIQRLLALPVTAHLIVEARIVAWQIETERTHGDR